jgi:hypothetical protein
MFGFLGNLLGNAASYVTNGHPAPSQPDDADGEWPDSPEEKERKRRQGLIQDRVRAQQGRARQGQQAQQPAYYQQQGGGNPWQHPLAQAHFGAQKDMFAATNNAWQREMDSRAQQASEARQQAHERSIEAMRQQGAMARSQQQQAPDNNQELRRRQKNAMLMRMAGMGGHRITSNGNGVSVSPLGMSLLG